MAFFLLLPISIWIFFHLGLPLEEKWRILAVGQNESQSFFALPHVPHPPTIVIIVRLHAAV